MLIKAGVDVRRMDPDLLKRLDCVDKIYLANKETLTLIPPYGGTREELSLYCDGRAVDIADPFKVSDKFWDKINDCFDQDYYVVFELERILVQKPLKDPETPYVEY